MPPEPPSDGSQDPSPRATPVVPTAPVESTAPVALTAPVVLPTTEDTHAWGERLGRLLRPGDLVVLTGELGAGKTTLTQGIGDGLGVRGPVTSPTFVIARVHPSLVGGPALVHVDAYRLGGFAELDDLDLDESVDDCVTVVEWGHGLAEDLADDRLEVTLSGEDTRWASVQTHGPRWAKADLTSLEVPA